MKKNSLSLVIIFSICSINQTFGQSIFEEIQKTIATMREEFNVVKKEMESISEKMELGLPKIESGYDKDKNIFFIKVPLPGFEKKDIEITIKSVGDEKMLIISAEREEQTTKQDASGKKEFKTGLRKFETTHLISEDVNIEATEWSYENDILQIKIPMKKAAGQVTVIKSRG